jgi:hypothetical protein
MVKVAEKLPPVNLSFISLADQSGNFRNLPITNVLNSKNRVEKYFGYNPTHLSCIELHNGSSTDKYDICVCEYAGNNNHYQGILEKIFNFNKDSHADDIDGSMYIPTLDLNNFANSYDTILVSLKIKNKNYIYNFELPSLKNSCFPSFVIDKFLFDVIGVKNLSRDVEFSVIINGEVYIALTSCIYCPSNYSVIFFPQNIIRKDIYNFKFLKNRTKKMHIYGHAFEIYYPEYKDESNNMTYNLQPDFVQKYYKHPTFIYKIAIALYVASFTDKQSQRCICDFIKSIFGLECFNHSILSRLISDYSKKLGIFEFEKLTEEQKNLHEMTLSNLHIKVNKSGERKYSHHIFRRIYISCWLKSDINLNWFIKDKSIILPDGCINFNLIDINSELFQSMIDDLLPRNMKTVK